MVTKYGMSEVMGPVEYGENQEEVFLGRSVTQTQSVSEEVAQKIDKEIRKLVDEGYNKAREILTEKIDDLHKIAKALITYETLTGEEIENIINKNIYPADKQDLKVDDDKSSAYGCNGTKTKNCSLILMSRYYTRVCNFYYGNHSKNLVQKKKAIPLHQIKEISFDQIEILTRKSKKKISIHQIKRLSKTLKKKINLDLKKIKSKKKNFANLNFKKIPNILGVLNLTPDSFSDGGKFNTKKKSDQPRNKFDKPWCKFN